MPDWSLEHISAVTLAVRDMAESVAFYERLGLHVSYGGPNAAFTTMRAGRSVINLRRAPQGSGNRWARVILRVQGVDALYQHLRAQGARGKLRFASGIHELIEVDEHLDAQIARQVIAARGRAELTHP